MSSISSLNNFNLMQTVSVLKETLRVISVLQGKTNSNIDTSNTINKNFAKAFFVFSIFVTLQAYGACKAVLSE